VVSAAADIVYMGRALRLAERGRGQTSPNPMVGAVIVAADGTIVGLGYHRKAGEPHAEIHALEMAGARARGATLYCTLEPCAHVGKTGPCCVVVAAAGLARVVVATADPNPLVCGRGLAYLRQQHVEVVEGVLAAEAERLNVAFFTAMRKGRPWVVMKVATSLDGAVAAGAGERTPLTSAHANRRVHRFRAEIDAIGVGSNTVLIDDPQLTVRGVYRDRPLVRVILDSRLRTPETAAVFRTRDRGPIVLATTEGACRSLAARASALHDAGAEFIVTPERDLTSVLRALGDREIRSLVLEGGPSVHRAAWKAGVVDHVQVFVTPCWLGPSAVAWDMPGDFRLTGLADRRVTPLGPDVLLEGSCSQG
jgi:diaminohydroxyphosphoribosylaminopyrimidine deaminase/5-amino-6-(5-phosphoribosylamino)uracil reductase